MKIQSYPDDPQSWEETVRDTGNTMLDACAHVRETGQPLMLRGWQGERVGDLCPPGEFETLRKHLAGIVNHFYEFADQPGCAGIDERMSHAYDFLHARDPKPPEPKP